MNWNRVLYPCVWRSMVKYIVESYRNSLGGGKWQDSQKVIIFYHFKPPLFFWTFFIYFFFSYHLYYHCLEAILDGTRFFFFFFWLFSRQYLVNMKVIGTIHVHVVWQHRSATTCTTDPGIKLYIVQHRKHVYMYNS